MANENDQIIRPSFPNQQNLPNQRGEEELDAYNLQLLSAIEACWLEIPEMRPNIKRMKAIVFANLKSSGSGSLVDQMIKMMEDVVFYEWQQHISEILLKMRTFVSNFKLAQRPEESLMVRIGFHSVAVAAGVVGLQALVNAYSVKLSISLHAWCNCTCPTAKDGPKNEAAVCLVFNAESAEVDNDTSIFNLNALEFLVNNIPVIQLNQLNK
uniref:Guanylate cyclase domain-containing protein n=1 Tax=Globodera pallida TaxID=36090 RepID=A0A183CKS6_GLOPA